MTTTRTRMRMIFAQASMLVGVVVVVVIMRPRRRHNRSIWFFSFFNCGSCVQRFLVLSALAMPQRKSQKQNSFFDEKIQSDPKWKSSSTPPRRCRLLIFLVVVVFGFCFGLWFRFGFSNSFGNAGQRIQTSCNAMRCCVSLSMAAVTAATVVFFSFFFASARLFISTEHQHQSVDRDDYMHFSSVDRLEAASNRAGLWVLMRNFMLFFVRLLFDRFFPVWCCPVERCSVMRCNLGMRFLLSTLDRAGDR